MADILNQNFASDEEDEDDFNPAPAMGSDDEGDDQRERSGRAKLPRNSSTPEDQSDEIKQDDEGPAQSRTNGVAEDDRAPIGDEEEEEDDEGGIQRTHTRDNDDDLEDEEAEEDPEEEEEEEDEDEAVTVCGSYNGHLG